MQKIFVNCAQGDITCTKAFLSTQLCTCGLMHLDNFRNVFGAALMSVLRKKQGNNRTACFVACSPDGIMLPGNERDSNIISRNMLRTGQAAN